MEEQKTKYQEIVVWVKKRLEDRELRAGSRLESEYQICSIFHVSRQTVRRALSDLERQGIVESRRGSGTYIRKAVNVGKEEKTMQVAVMTTYIQEYIFSTILQQIENELSRSGYGMSVSFTNNKIEKERMILKNILEKNRVDGLIAEPTMSGIPNPNLDLYRELMNRGIPVLFFNSYYPELAAPHVSLNDRMAGKMVTEHLIKCGHRKIAGIFKADDGQGHVRYAGYVDALMEADIKVRGRRVVWIDSETVKNMRDGQEWLLKRIQGCTACVCYNDEVASNLVGLCRENGISVPDDLSVIGIDDSEIATYCEVPLTSAKNPISDLGRIAALEMLEMIKGMPVPKTTELDPEIVNRNSVRILNDLYA